MKNKFLVVLFVSLAFKSVAQNHISDIYYKIDSLESIGQPAAAIKEINKLELSKNNKIEGISVKNLIYKIRLMAYMKQDAINDILNAIKSEIERAKFPEKQIFESILASFYFQYYNVNFYKISQRNYLDDENSDFTNWTAKRVLKEAEKFYTKSLSEKEKLFAIPIEEISEVLNGDVKNRILRPQLYDLLLHRALDFYWSQDVNNSYVLVPDILRDSSIYVYGEDFMSINFNKDDHPYMKGFKLLQEAIKLHKEKENYIAIADLDIRKLTFLKQLNSNIVDESYIKALEKIAYWEDAGIIQADALYLLAEAYYSIQDYKNAVKYYNHIIERFPETGNQKEAAKELEKLNQIAATTTIEEYQIPNEPILVLLKYRNLTQLKISIYKSDTHLKLKGLLQNPKLKTEALNYMKNIAVFKTQLLDLPIYDDHKTRSTEFMLEPLPLGQYTLVLENAEKPGDVLNFNHISISNLSVLHSTNSNDYNFLILNRKNGLAIENANIIVEQIDIQNNQIKNTINGVTKKDGSLVLSAKDVNNNSFINITATSEQDTVLIHRMYVNRPYKKSSYTFKEDDYKAVIFTDKSIYRPGQTVYYKAIVINPKEKTNKLIENYKTEVKLRINNQDIYKDTLTTNSYGSFSGSFKLPDNLQNREVTITIGNRKAIHYLQVAEYKKPSFQLLISQQKPNYKYLDTVVYKGVVKNYAGFGVSNTKITYHIRQSDLSGTIGLNFVNLTKNIADTLTTNSLGEFEIKFLAKHQNPYPNPRLNYSQYNIKVKATDIAGETQESNLSLKVAYQNLSLSLNIKDLLTKATTEESKIFVYNSNGYPTKATLKTELYKLSYPRSYKRERYWSYDAFFKHILSEDEFFKHFPNYHYLPINNQIQNGDLIEKINYPEEVSESVINLKSLAKLKTGYYRLKVIAMTNDGDSISTQKQFYYVNKEELVAQPRYWIVAEQTEMKPGQKAKFSLNLPDSHVWMTVYKNGELLRKELIQVIDKPQVVHLEANKTSQIEVSFLMVHDNRVYNENYNLTYKNEDLNLQAEIIDFNSQMQPGKSQNIKIKILDKKGKPQVAEVLGVLFDASLSKLSTASNWLESYNRTKRVYFSRTIPNWNNFNFNSSKSYHNIDIHHYAKPLARNYEHLNLNKYNYYGNYNMMFETYNNRNKRIKINKYQDSLIQEQYLSNVKKYKNGFDYSGRIIDENIGLAGVIIKVKGSRVSAISNSFGYFTVRLPEKGVLIFSYKGEVFKELFVSEANKYQLIHYPNFKQYESSYKRDISGAVSNLDEEIFTSYGTQKGDQDLNIRGSSTTNQEFLKTSVPSNVFTHVADVPVRRFFNETAFFYPALKTNKKGELNIDFKLPESLTTWKLKLFAIHKSGVATAIEKDIVASKKLMVLPNMPRFLRVGDTTQLSVRVVNNSNTQLEALFNASFYNKDDKPLQVIIQEPKNKLILKANTVDTVQLKVVLTENFEYLKYKFTAQTKDDNDGIEDQIPVLSNKILVTEVLPLQAYKNEDAKFTFHNLINQKSNTLEHQNLIFEYTYNPNWQVLESLPYSTSINNNCSENVLSSLVINRLSSGIIKSNLGLRDTLKFWASMATKSSLITENLNTQQPNLILNNQIQRQAILGSLADEQELEKQYRNLLETLKSLQSNDGGFPWFSGLKNDVFISQHILASLGRLVKTNQVNFYDFKPITQKLNQFVIQQILADKNINLNLHAWYALSFFPDEQAAHVNVAKERYLKIMKENWLHYNLYQQALISLTAYRAGDKELSKLINSSIKDRAMEDKELGVYWAKNNFGCFWYELPLETQSVLISLFEETEPNSTLLEKMKLWLLKHKQVNHWGNTKTTAEACFALLKNATLVNKSLPDIKIANQPIKFLKPRLSPSFGYLTTNFQKEEIKPELGIIEISNAQNTTWGAMYWQYLEDAGKITLGARGLSIYRKYFVLNQKGSYDEVLQNTKLEVGDVLKVVLYVKADRDFDYILLKDLRPANTEPQDVLSKYLYKGSLFYYQVTKDQETNFYISYLNKGSYTIEYQLNIAQSGVFTSGIASVESLYAPDFRGHTVGQTLRVK